MTGLIRPDAINGQISAPFSEFNNKGSLNELANELRNLFSASKYPIVAFA